MASTLIALAASAAMALWAAGPTPQRGTGLDPASHLDTHRLRPGMSGVGKTVFSGTQIETFDVEVISVMHNVDPAREMILVRCDSPQFRRTGVARGMSGSPVYIRDPLDGRLKLIGAIAYGWAFQNEPVVGVQPIRGMLEIGAAPTCRTGSGVWSVAPDPQDRFVLAGLIAPRSEPARTSDAPTDGFVPIGVPLVVSGGSPAAMEWLGQQLAGTSLMPAAAGGSVAAEQYPPVRLEPGSALCVPILQGDMEMTIVGTVTEVRGRTVLGFGHALVGEGRIEMPLATGYIHTVMSSLARSFKLGALLQVVGTLTQDEYTGVLGVEGRKARQIPLTISVAQDGVNRSYTYQAVDNDYFTPLAVGTALSVSITAQHDLPREHTIRYRHRVRFAGLGEYVVDNFTSQTGMRQVRSDLLSPLQMMLDNPFGRAQIEQIDCRIEIESQPNQAAMERVQLLRDRVRPGSTLRLDVTWMHFRRARQSARYEMPLPQDLPEGKYQLVVCSWREHLKALRKEKPHMFQARSLPQLLQAVQTIAEIREDRLYCRLVSKRGGVAFDGVEMPLLPSCRAAILTDSKRSDVKTYQQALVVSHPVAFAVSGMRSFTVTVDKRAPL